MKETLEEVAEKYANQYGGVYLPCYDSYLAGAKWQAERSYNENEVFMILESYRNWNGANFHQGECL